MKHLIVIFFYVFIISCSAYSNRQTTSDFNELEYFDKKLLSVSKVLELKTTISIYNREDVADDHSSESCLVYTYRFDPGGNIIRQDLNRTGTYHGFYYDKNGILFDWSWEDKSSGEITLFSDVLKDEKNKFEKERLAIDKRISAHLDTRIDYNLKMIRSITDPCFNIDSVYELIHAEDDGILPKSAVAHKIKEKGSLSNEAYKSPEKLYIYYDYILYNEQ